MVTDTENTSECQPNIRRSNSLHTDPEETETEMFKLKSMSVSVPTYIYTACRKAC
ncbi:unnamed protein product, partial [Larinioides sclopetarius]